MFHARVTDFRLQPPRIGICDNTSAPLFRAGTDPLRLKLLLIDVLEQLAVKTPSAIHVKFENNEESLVTTLSIEKKANYLLTLHKAAYYTAMMQLLGGDFIPDEDDRMYHARFYIPITNGKGQPLSVLK